MEFLEEETRPRFHLHSRFSPTSDHPTPPTAAPLLRPCLFVSLSLSSLFLSLSIFNTQSEPLNSLLLWISLSLLLGPFAPDAITSGDIRVGVGKLLADPPIPSDEPAIEKPQFPNRWSKNRRFDELGQNQVPESTLEPEKESNLGKFYKSVQNPVPESAQDAEKVLNSGRSLKSEGGSIRVSKEEKEWSEGDVEMLKKLVIKHPVGKPKRWEAISEAFGGAHGVDSVIKMAKSMGEKKMSDSDSFARFLKDRKQLDRRVEAEEAEVSSWSGGDDVALLNALKAFPKETAMGWEKIAVAVPGKTKAACVKRVTELKRDFRSSKGSNEG